MELTICPLCNGFESLHIKCEKCNSQLLDQGRMADYYDDYSAYEPINLIKLENGISHDYRLNKCAHFVFCSTCQQASILLVSELKEPPDDQNEGRL
ncbi:hypothetical protein [Evansella halocellulosilytica]|uniref:hypothetical protein n=1 Tax=Evansella halocellulosilytica TaxID=2011013 RepID=UPI000BB6E3FA|nr:hypothetical protein [Evansella halocellulosilytica]